MNINSERINSEVLAKAPETNKSIPRKQKHKEKSNNLNNSEDSKIKKVNLQTLDPEEWLDDTVINEYCSMLSKTFPDKVYIFSTHFLNSLKRSGYEYNRTWTKKENIFLRKFIIFPLHEKSHWVLCFLNNETFEMTILDPYNEARNSNVGNSIEKVTETLRKGHLNSMQLIEKVFITPHQKFYGVELKKQIEFVIKFPPQIPSQLNHYDCGVFLLQFAKQICMDMEFRFSCHDMCFLRQQIKEELTTNQLVIKSQENYSQEE